MNECLFCKIVKKEIPADIVYEDVKIMAFKDINPAAAVHVLIVPKEHISAVVDIDNTNSEIIGYIFAKVNEIAAGLGIKEKGFRVIVNCGKDGGQVIYHLHFHLLGGQKLGKLVG